MKHRIAALVLTFALLFSLCGCNEIVSEIAGNVADAALKELEEQVKETLQEYKIEIVEVKSSIGKLSDESDSSSQFFCSVLVRSNSDALLSGAAGALNAVFDRTGVQVQSGSKIENDLLQNKSLSYNHTDFSTGNYYTIWAYTVSLTQKLSELEIPGLPEDWLPKDGASAEGVG